MTGRAWINIDAQLVAEALGLPKHMQIVRANMDGTFDFSLRLGIEGDGLPVQAVGELTPELIAIVRQEEVGGIRRVFVSFSHAPEKEWLAFERLVPQPTVIEGSNASPRRALS